MVMFMGTWADMRPIKTTFSPVSGWKAESYTYLALHSWSSVSPGVATPALQKLARNQQAVVGIRPALPVSAACLGELRAMDQELWHSTPEQTSSLFMGEVKVSHMRTFLFLHLCGPAFSPGPRRWWFSKGLKGLGGTPRVKPPEEKRITAWDSPLGPCPCRVNCTGNGH